MDDRVWTYLPHCARQIAKRCAPACALARAPAAGDAGSARVRKLGRLRARDAQHRRTFQATIMHAGSATIGYIVFPDHWRRGYAVEAMTRCARICAKRTRSGASSPDMDRRNEASVAVAPTSRLGRSRGRERGTIAPRVARFALARVRATRRR